MFKPTSKITKILGAYGTCAYIHRDGIAILERKSIKIDRDNSMTVEVWHLIPCEINISIMDYANRYVKPVVDRVLVYDCKLIAHGFDGVYVALNNNSDSASKHGLSVTTIEFVRGDHVWYDTSIPGLIGGNVTCQPDNYMRIVDKSIASYVDMRHQHGTSVIVYGDMPVEISTLQPVAETV